MFFFTFWLGSTQFICDSFLDHKQRVKLRIGFIYYVRLLAQEWKIEIDRSSMLLCYLRDVESTRERVNVESWKISTSLQQTLFFLLKDCVLFGPLPMCAPRDSAQTETHMSRRFCLFHFFYLCIFNPFLWCFNCFAEKEKVHASPLNWRLKFINCSEKIFRCRHFIKFWKIFFFFFRQISTLIFRMFGRETKQTEWKSCFYLLIRQFYFLSFCNLSI